MLCEKDEWWEIEGKEAEARRYLTLDIKIGRCDDDVVRPRMYERMKWV